jgi:hypothetical protein
MQIRTNRYRWIRGRRVVAADKPRYVFHFKISESWLNFRIPYLEFYKSNFSKLCVSGFRKMSRIYFQHKILLLHLFYTLYYCKLYFCILAIKNSCKFYFIVIPFVFDQYDLPLYCSMSRSFSVPFSHLCRFNLYELSLLWIKNCFKFSK